MSDDNGKNDNPLKKWTEPGVILQLVGFVALVVAAWVNIGVNAKAIEANKEEIKSDRSEMITQLYRIDDKLDRILINRDDRRRQ